MPRIASEAFYKQAIKKHGVTPQGLCWLSHAHQQMRFDMIYELLPEDLQESTLVDAGCGFGDFYSYLEHNNNLPKEYIGIDSIDTMCEIARKKTNSQIIHADLTNTEIKVSDYIVCSGAMNLLTYFETLLFINNCYKSSKKAFVFNILCGEDNSYTYNYFSKQKIKSVAKELNVGRVKFFEGYLENDITVAFYRA